MEGKLPSGIKVTMNETVTLRRRAEEEWTRAEEEEEEEEPPRPER